MNVVAHFRPRPVAGVSTVDTADGLSAFCAPQSAAVVWQREMPQDVASWIDALDPAQLPSGRVVLPPNTVSSIVAHLCDMAETPSGASRDWLVADITMLADHFARVMQTRFLRLRLDVVTTNACRRFHCDAITGRLVCTYRGTGTQYGTSVDHADPASIQTVQRGAPILLRGSLWPPRPNAGLLHRSPPIEGTGETRLVLVLDPVDDPDEEQ